MALPEILRSKPTQAKPRHTLCGTVLERPAFGDKDDDITLPEIQEKPKESYLMGNPVYDVARAEFDGQARVYRRAVDNLQTDEKRSFYFSNNGLSVKPTVPSTGDRMSLQPDTGRSEHRDKYIDFQKQPFYQLKAMNRIGLTQAGSFNRDKYRPRVSDKPFSIFGQIVEKNNGVVGQGRRLTRSVPYSNHMGGPLVPGHSLVPPITSSSTMTAPSQASRKENVGSTRRNTSLTLPDHQRPMSPCSGQVPDYSVPVALKHKYGTKVVDSLIKETDIKDAYFNYQRGKWLEWKRARERFHPSSEDADMGNGPSNNTTYAILSRSLRSNTFGGPPVELESETIGNYNHAAIARKPEYADNTTDSKLKRRKDSMMDWTEHNVINEKMRRTWDQYMKERREAHAAQLAKEAADEG